MGRRILVALSGLALVLAMAGCGASDPSQSPNSSTTTATAGTLPPLDLPGTRGGEPGEYGWTGPGSRGMHWVTDDEAAAMHFAVEDSCFARSADAVPVTIAGYDGAYLEPYEPPVVFSDVGDEVTRAYELQIGSGTLCIYVTWHPTTTADELAATLGILDTLRAEHRDDGRIRINFTLADRWDTG
jgi:hypothetical protein